MSAVKLRLPLGDALLSISVEVRAWNDEGSNRPAEFSRLASNSVELQFVTKHMNCALASLFSTPPGVSAAVAELKAIPPDDAPGEYRSMLELGFEDATLVFTEWRPPSDGSADPPLKSFVESAIVALERAIASGAPQRVIAARREV